MVALTLAACAGPEPLTSPLPIAAARGLFAGAQVTVEGLVTVSTGTFDDGFALADATGGIYVTRARGSALVVGERVRVAGRVVAPNGQTGLEPSAITRAGAGRTPTPLAVKTGAAGPATEGRLIAVRGQLTGGVIDDQPWGWKFYVDDGSGPLLVFIATPARIDVRGLRAGLRLRVAGFSGRYEEHTELLPRGPHDISLLAD